MDQMEDDPMSTSSPMNESIKEEGNNKRKDPESRTVVVAPRKETTENVAAQPLHEIYLVDDATIQTDTTSSTRNLV